MRFGAEPARLPDAVVERIVSRIDKNDGLIKLASPELVAGQEVRVVDGPLVGLDGVFVCVEGADRARLLLQLLGVGREIVVPRSQLGVCV